MKIENLTKKVLELFVIYYRQNGLTYCFKSVFVNKVHVISCGMMEVSKIAYYRVIV